MMELIVEALETTKEAVGKSNTNAASDLGVAALNLKAGLQGAWLNVLINISGIKDQDFVQEYHGKGLKLLQTGSELADSNLPNHFRQFYLNPPSKQLLLTKNYTRKEGILWFYRILKLPILSK